jgi:hypothetical protein
MAKRENTEISSSRRAEDHAEMLKIALSRPGVREVMEVYGSWQEKSSEIDVYRSAVEVADEVVTTNYTTAR